jgi:hypothetical protein
MQMNSSIALQVRRLSRAHATVHRQDVMNAGDLEFVASLLIAHQPLNYDSYCMVRDQLPPRFSRIFTASLFARVSGHGTSKGGELVALEHPTPHMPFPPSPTNDHFLSCSFNKTI